MKTKLQHRPICEEAPLRLLDVVAAVSDFAANDRETARVVNHMLTTRRIRFVEALDREEISLLHS